MTRTEIVHWAINALAILGVVWNKLAIKTISVAMDGLQLKYMKSEKQASFRQGQQDNQVGEDEDRSNLK